MQLDTMVDTLVNSGGMVDEPKVTHYISSLTIAESACGYWDTAMAVSLDLARVNCAACLRRTRQVEIPEQALLRTIWQACMGSMDSSHTTRSAAMARRKAGWTWAPAKPGFPSVPGGLKTARGKLTMEQQHWQVSSKSTGARRQSMGSSGPAPCAGAACRETLPCWTLTPPCSCLRPFWHELFTPPHLDWCKPTRGDEGDPIPTLEVRFLDYPYRQDALVLIVLAHDGWNLSATRRGKAVSEVRRRVGGAPLASLCPQTGLGGMAGRNISREDAEQEGQEGREGGMHGGVRCHP